MNGKNLAALFGAVLAIGPLQASELDYGLRVGGIHTDNPRRSGSAEQDDTIAFVGLDLDWSADESSRVDWSLFGNVDYHHYVDDTFDDEVLGAVNLDVDAAVLPDRLHWIVTHRYGQLVTDPFLASTVDNRGDVNNFATGPDLTVRLGARSSAVLGGRYQANRFEERNADNDVAQATFTLQREVRENRTLSLTASYEDVDFDDTLNPDYERYAASLGFRSRVSRGSISLSAGWNEIEIGDETRDGLLADLSVSRELSSQTTLTLGYSQRYSNAGDLFNRLQDPAAGGNFGQAQEIAGDADPFESRGINLGLNSSHRGNTWSVRFLSLDESFDEFNPLDRERLEAQLQIGREIARGWRVTLNGRFARFDFRNVDREDDDVTARIRISRQLTRRFDLLLGYAYVDRSSSDPVADFTENRYTLTLQFAPE